MITPEVAMSFSALKLQVMLKGRPLQEFTFTQQVVRIGRDPKADVILDNMGVSREQAKITSTPEGWILEDCGSANGTWLNGRRVERTPLHDRDELVMGKFTLSVGLEANAKVLSGLGNRRPGPQQEIDGTTVLSRGQLAAMLQPEEQEDLEEVDSAPGMAVPKPTGNAQPSRRRQILLAVGFVAALIMGAALASLVLR